MSRNLNGKFDEDVAGIKDELEGRGRTRAMVAGMPSSSFTSQFTVPIAVA